MARWMKVLLWIVIAGVVLFVVIQLVPYGRDHSNPPVTNEPNWDSPRTRELAKAACFDCHSNETDWPWYSGIAPASWLLYRDVSKGRDKLNFSEWPQLPAGAGAAIADRSAELIDGGEMPPARYGWRTPRRGSRTARSRS